MNTSSNRPSRSAPASGYRSSRGPSTDRRPSSSGRSAGVARNGGYVSSGGRYAPPRRSSFSGGSRGGGGNRGGGRARSTFDVNQYINRNPVSAEVEAPYVPTHAFTDFGLDASITNLLAEAGLNSPSPIQDQIIGHIVDGKDVIGLANTGTGKTAAFLLPLINATLKDDNKQTLILAPTRELAIQIQDELRKFTRGMRIFSTICVGGTPIRPQIMSLRRKNHFIIGTPGRVLDLIDHRNFNPGLISAVVLDEADRMLDMGFIHDMKKILIGTPKERQTLFFSATMSADIERLVHEFLREPVTVSVKKKDITGSIEQDVVRYSGHDKFKKLLEILEDPSFSRVLIFGAMKHSVEKLSLELEAHGIKADSIHGNKSHPQRQRALRRFKDGDARVLVATDVAARGIHVDNVSHVINYDLPAAYEDYIHRIGRTGRGTNHGKALTFVSA